MYVIQVMKLNHILKQLTCDIIQVQIPSRCTISKEMQSPNHYFGVHLLHKGEVPAVFVQLQIIMESGSTSSGLSGAKLLGPSKSPAYLNGML